MVHYQQKIEEINQKSIVLDRLLPKGFKAPLCCHVYPMNSNRKPAKQKEEKSSLRTKTTKKFLGSVSLKCRDRKRINSINVYEKYTIRHGPPSLNKFVWKLLFYHFGFWDFCILNIHIFGLAIFFPNNFYETNKAHKSNMTFLGFPNISFSFFFIKKNGQ